jgi:hypothetical protein
VTIFWPDVSNYQNGLVLEPKTVALVAKATQGTGGVDAAYIGFKNQAAAQGSIFSGYHFLEQGNGAAQAQHYFSVAGSTPCMIDCESDGSSQPGVQDCLDFYHELTALGGRAWAVYLPAWYWGTLGNPDLSPLSSMALVASAYNGYSDTAPGWNSYGNVAPSVLQFSDTFQYSGQGVDFNAYRGTVEQFRALVYNTPVPVPPPAPKKKDHDMLILRVQGQTNVFGLSGGKLWHITDIASLSGYVAAGVPQATVTAEEINAINGGVSPAGATAKL